ncbi:hypothetical protein HELRODRAFT_73994 [Helobdella robusta]|uniref:DNA-directed RNA polymerase subunit n=1 Tax=Helobdella robusta TaxID=6412 RepID=T1G1K9_HELRO|nr:hypothetical protein HELRODRAFT_73994 [Helobdella robusta]ESO08954.1 hypothetical protein HELRODRAFT_73994 [Helobdella robusta]
MHFCKKCGTIMQTPEESNKSFALCYNSKCGHTEPIEASCQETTYELLYNTQQITNKKNDNEEYNRVLGPTIERQCSFCRYRLAAYFTRQMRSADEGQSVFYTCLNCKRVEREDS